MESDFLVLKRKIRTTFFGRQEIVRTSPPMATSDPDAATALGSNDGFCSKTFWFDRKASIFPISAMKTVESFATATDLG